MQMKSSETVQSFPQKEYRYDIQLDFDFSSNHTVGSHDTLSCTEVM